MSTERTYTEVMDTITSCAKTFAFMSLEISTKDAETAQACVDLADSIGPVLHPSQWIGANKKQSLERQLLLMKWFTSSRKQLAAIFPDYAGAINPPPTPDETEPAA